MRLIERGDVAVEAGWGTGLEVIGFADIWIRRGTGKHPTQSFELLAR